MTISPSSMHVLVDDPDAALSFYRDTLGLTMRNEVARDGFRWITLVTDSQPEIEIVLSQPHASYYRSPSPNPGEPATSPCGTPRAIMSASSRDRTWTTPSGPAMARAAVRPGPEAGLLDSGPGPTYS
jgi:catechol 2,3-dioxygenase-like lactoylglutathione lyase family enzyme